MKQSIDVLLDQYIDQVLLEQLGGRNAVFKQGAAAPTYQSTDQKIAKKIYDSKGYIYDDEKGTIQAVKSIKTQAQYKNVESAFKSIAGGQTIVGYIRTFTKISDRLLMAVYLDGIGISIATCKKYITQDEFFKITDPASLAQKYLGRGTNIEKAVLHVIMDPQWQYKAHHARVPLNSGNEWFKTHNTWDTFINGADFESDGMRDAAYSTTGIVVSVAASVIPYVNILPRAMFGILLVDDVYRLATGKETAATIWDDIIFDLMGVAAGTAAAGAAFKGLGRLLGTIATKSFVITKSFIQACIRICGPGIQKLLNSLLTLCGTGLSKITTSIFELLGKWGSKYPAAKNLIKMVGQKIKGFAELVNNLLLRPIAILKFIIQAGAKLVKSTAVGAARLVKIIAIVVREIVKAPGDEIYYLVSRVTSIEWIATAFKLAFNTSVTLESFAEIERWMANRAEAKEKKERDQYLDDIINDY